MLNLTFTDAHIDKPVIITLTPDLTHELEYFAHGTADCEEAHTRFFLGTTLTPKVGYFCVIETPEEIEEVMNNALEDAEVAAEPTPTTAWGEPV